MKKFLLIVTLITSMHAFAQNEDAVEAYNQGITLYNERNLEAALQSFDKAILADPLFSKAWFSFFKPFN